VNLTKILILTSEFPPQPGGIATHAHYLALSLQKEGKQVIVLSDIRSKDGKIEKDFDAQLPFKVHRIKRRKIIEFSYLDRFLNALKHIKRTNTVIASGKFSLWLVFFLKLFYRKKYIAIIHGSEVLLSNKILRKFTNSSLKKFDTVIAVSNFTKSLVKNLSLKSSVVIPNGFDISMIKYSNYTKPKTEKLRLITIGNVTQRKGQQNVVKAIPLLLKSHPELHYHIVGIPTEKENIYRLANELGVADQIIFHGKVSEEDKWELLDSSSIFVMLSENTSYGDVEGFGIAILEANSMGVPSIGSKGCGIEDAINEGKSGILIDAHNPESFLRAVNEINNNYSEFSENAIQWSEKFGWDKIIKQYLQVLDK